MSSSSKSDGGSSFDAEELLHIGTRCRELGFSSSSHCDLMLERDVQMIFEISDRNPYSMESQGTCQYISVTRTS